MTEKKKLSVVFAPGALEEMEQNMTPEELQELMNALGEVFSDPELLAESSFVIENFEDLSKEDQEIINERPSALDHGRPRVLH